jgi:hypothetical protein
MKMKICTGGYQVLFKQAQVTSLEQISSTAPPEAARTSLSLSEDPLCSRTSSGFAAASTIGGKRHGRRGQVGSSGRFTGDCTPSNAKS